MLLNTSTKVILMAAGAVIFSGVAAAQAKIAVVNLQQAVLQTAEIKKASADLEAKYKPKQAEMEKLEKEIAEIQQKLQAGAGKLTPQAQQELTLEGQRKQRDLQRLQQDVQDELNYERNEILQKSGQQMAEIIRKLAEEKQLDVVVDFSSTLYIKPSLDLTAEAVAAYDKAYPPK
ncbi:MAG TPA: OmpH family outer membrane protein [Bryobacteraceae bacterium]|nr:OmpH family outer membrane protein [Bryobacteraceae bacterium]HOL70486.1 OmpH family outer membrane protein [Bryobacteraceae bacterium]HOQ46089.1 OmpH family outer membrane protein [Bryobacteraceae bacterium]HPQ15756.1 OmpH family outer membrane protein [Bryobacteraceae bacterium]HPU72800.1 OmpH family outer membrane protein [Bryobacteraceae bacterium]